jgi:hypothetical protein
VDKDGFVSNEELFQVLKLMVGNNLKDIQLQQVGGSLVCSKKRGGGWGLMHLITGVGLLPAVCLLR